MDNEPAKAGVGDAARSQVAQPTANRYSTNDEFPVVVFTFALVLLLGNFAVWGFSAARHEPAEIVIPTLFAFVGSELGLLAVWLAFSALPLPLRLLALVPANAIIFLPFFLADGNRFELEGFAACNVIVLVIAIAPLVMRMAGWRVVRFDNPADASTWRPNEKPMQFTLRQMFSWTLAVAMVSALIKFAFASVRARETDDGYFVFEFLIPMIMLSVVGCAICALIWAGLGRTNAGFRFGILVGIVAFASCAIPAGFGAPAEGVGLFTLGTVATALMTGGALLGLRRIGFRLVRPRCDQYYVEPIKAEVIGQAAGPFDS